MRITFTRAILPLPLLLALTTAGCFRQAGEGIEPTITGAPLVANPQPTAPESEPSPAGAEATSESLVFEPVEASSPQADTLATAPATTAAPTVALIVVTSTPRYITPQVPLGFTTPDTPAPTVPSVLDTAGLTSTPGQLSFILPSSSDILATPTNLPGVEDECVHIIQGGDTLYGIALNYGYTVQDLLDVNPDLGDASAVIQPGDPIRLPLPECIDAEATADPDGTTPATARPTSAPPAVPTATPARPDGSQVHVVQSGDVLYNIAVQYGTTVNAIVQANNLANPNALQIGQELIIPPSN